MVINGVVFAASAGQRNTPAVLYALDGSTGKELWNSGKSIAGMIPRNGGITGGGTQIYLGTHDGTLYAFGFPMEH
jgi:outer membrane protein assembly factor BamB